MKCLIVGCGYVGLPLGAELVRQGHEVFGLRRSASAANEMKSAGIQPLVGDVTRLKTLAKLPRQFDWALNCVAAGGSADNYRQIYLEGNRNLVSWLAESPPEKFIYTSSTSVYGQNDGSIVTEKSPVKPDAETAKVLVEAETCLLAKGGSRGRSPHQSFAARFDGWNFGEVGRQFVRFERLDFERNQAGERHAEVHHAVGAIHDRRNA